MPRYGDFGTQWLDLNSGDFGGYGQEKDPLDRNALYQWLQDKYQSAGNTDLGATGIDAIGKVLATALFGAKYESPQQSTMARKMVANQINDMLGLGKFEESKQALDYHKKRMAFDAGEREKDRAVHEAQRALQERELGFREKEFETKHGKPLPDDYVESLLNAPGATLMDFLPGNTAEKLQLDKPAAVYLHNKAIEHFREMTPERQKRPFSMNLEQPSNETPLPSGSSVPGLEMPRSYEEAQGMPGGPLAALGPFLQEHLAGTLPGEAPGGGYKTKAQRAEEKEARMREQAKNIEQHRQAGEELATGREERQSKKDFLDRMKTTQQFMKSALEMADHLELIDKTGEGLEQDLPGMRPTGDIPGAGGVSNAIGGGLETLSATPYIGGLASPIAKPIGNALRTTTDEGRLMRQYANELKLLGSNLLLKGTGQISDVERQMASQAQGMDPTNVYADRDARLGLKRVIELARENVNSLAAEYPDEFKEMVARGHPIGKLYERLQSVYDPTEILQSGYKQGGQPMDTVEVTGPDGQRWRVHRRLGSFQGSEESGRW